MAGTEERESMSVSLNQGLMCCRSGAAGGGGDSAHAAGAEREAGLEALADALQAREAAAAALAEARAVRCAALRMHASISARAWGHIFGLCSVPPECRAKLRGEQRCGGLTAVHEECQVRRCCCAQAAEAAEAECRGELEGVEAELREVSARMSSQPQQHRHGKRGAKRPGSAAPAGGAGAERGGSEEADAPPAHAPEERRTKRRR
jgi:hypothetical protein